MNILAAFIFFTRLPFWRIREVPAESFRHVVNYWPLTGWLTGSVMVAAAWLSSFILPTSVAILLAIIVRILITGALHEDGLADFLDGFGGGNTRERTLEIMKDSHTGSYGVIGLILYFILLYTLLSSLPLSLLIIVIFTGDIWSKFIASQIVNVLPYARKQEESKNKTIYDRMTWKVFLFALISGAIPFVLLPVRYWLSALFPIVAFVILYILMKKRLQGYTGDCCGALFLLCELFFYLGTVIVFYTSQYTL